MANLIKTTLKVVSAKHSKHQCENVSITNKWSSVTNDRAF